ncbi:MAG: hypothetical protein CFE37_08670 [Alphaproteobacteria bacterium PA4]|nr:MAG: hypothetical protein CFE37_08670 [Alphaproteobacteria bacterium PA4]
MAGLFRRWSRLAVALAASLALAGPARAGDWEFIVNPYVMAPSSNGKFGVGPFETQISTSAAAVFRNLNWGVMGGLEANNGVWGVNLDINYMNVDVTDDDVRRLSVNGHQAAYTGTLLRRVHENAWVYAGLRLSDMGVALGCNQACPLPGGTPVRRGKQWVEALAGFRADLPFNDRLAMVMTADVGGFGFGSEISVNAWPQLALRTGRNSRALLGYRLIYVKHESGEGASRFEYDALTFGPTLGVEFRF